MITIVRVSDIDRRGEGWGRGRSFERGGSVPRNRVVSSDIDKGDGRSPSNIESLDRTDHKAKPRCYLGPISLSDRSFITVGPCQPNGRLLHRPVMAWFRFLFPS